MGKKKKILKKNKNRGKKKKPWWKYLIGFLVITAIGFFAYQAYVGFDSIWSKNRTGQSPFLQFGGVEAGQLRGEGDGRINILLLGVPGGNHQGPDLSDTNIVVSIDPVNNKVAMLSLPRDLWVEIPGNGSSKLNAVHAYGEQQGYEEGGGPLAAKRTVSEILDLPVNYFVRVDFIGLEKLIDAIGGVDVEVEESIYDPYFPQRDGSGYDPYSIAAGQHHLDGEEALKYARSRYTTSDFDRAARQQQVLKAVKKKISELNYLTQPGKLVEFINIASEHLKTDFQPDEIKRLATIIDKTSSEEMVTKVLDNSSDGLLVGDEINGTSVLVPKVGDYSQIQSLAHRIFTEPYLEEENAEIALLNGTTQIELAGQTAEILRDFGYNIVKVNDAEEKDYKKTVMVDYTDGKKPQTMDLLQKRIPQAQLMEDGFSDQEVDIVIVLGSDFEIRDLYR